MGLSPCPPRPHADGVQGGGREAAVDGGGGTHHVVSAPLPIATEKARQGGPSIREDRLDHFAAA